MTNKNFKSVSSSRILYTPSQFAKTNLLYLQETGKLEAISSHTNKREKLNSFLCFVVLKGKGNLEYDGRTYELKENDVVFIDCKKQYSHSTYSANLWTLMWCHFSGANLPAIYAKYCERGGEPVIHSENIQPFVCIMSEIYQIADSDDYIKDMKINEKLNILLTHLMRDSWHQGNFSSRKKKINIREIKSYIDTNFMNKISLESVARLFFVNKHYLARLFKEHYGISLTIYLQQVRITHAKQMLRFTNKKIEQIGKECGMDELSYFSRVFKKLEGVSPKEYRNLW